MTHADYRGKDYAGECLTYAKKIAEKIAEKEDSLLDQEEIVFIPEEHLWPEMPEDSVDEVIRFSLDEIRVG